MSQIRVGILSRILTNLKNTFFIAKSKAKFVGSDQFGNRYFEKAGDDEHSMRASRFIEKKPGQDYSDIPQIPVEWHAWLRGRRTDPPTPEEIEKNNAKNMQTKLRAQELEKKFAKQNLSSDSGSQAITEDIKPPQTQHSFPVYEEYEYKPGQKYNKDGSSIN
ncbi:NADH dehydrogenase [ubiquinone] 1 alpha subcomplex assembly factor 2-like [Physella acuta]|uniref:NADH dehydrogenase [ubiquinone] 1 alpha subcomplex assembly factor 2-like n=1 Tax=Physella acuta TaxID=109671 RepID=UPI0027DC30FB|nr:NADH dehydrogenase [ubiquinone] 1 alpha subcomplex assembly factor 2-like [Physella acuta]XP_059143071.1 NADH dehydrogenase [ubiquinone] 1 alpha subcomplex assembly factor 2-like [Physella acuta]XP_059143072.1 NADH dehydrogenase [ubiquinone] 1 alpha subcomplex assembly factor 2-like [Physella acuta]XP_059143073.1 NADH dehydrogenase [ubiquinone] 1 alpha subcomplex assembly factor 2-like [Physella acuta]XP_059143074.1 NADH dehydrogenase [ubiquinone] 1 alpha subcomplex assembly factor 2-like [P